MKVLLDELFGRECFLNEIVWAYDYGARPRRRWPAKHDTILVYVKDPERLLVRRRGGRARAVHGARPRHRREGGAREAADRRLVAHDRLADREGEDRLPDAEAGGHRAADRAGVQPAGRLVPRSASPARGPSAPSRAALGRRYRAVDSSPEAVEVVAAASRARFDGGLSGVPEF